MREQPGGRKRPKNLRGILFLIFLLAVGGVVLLKAKKAVAVFALAYGFSFLLEPLVQGLEKQGIRRTWAALWLYGVGLFVLVGVGTMVLPYLRLEVLHLLEQIPQYIQTGQQWYGALAEWYTQTFPIPFPVESMEERIVNLGNEMAFGLNEGLRWISSLIGGGVIWLLVPIVGFYFLKDKEKLQSAFYLLLPIRRKGEWQALLGQMGNAIRNFLKGSILVCAVVAICTTIGLWLIGVRFSILFGLVAGVFNIIPYFGPIIGGAPAVVAAMLQEPIKGLWAVAVIFLVQQIESHLITPKIMGDRLGLHPLAVIFALLAGGALFGIWGMVLAVPFVGVLRVALPFLIDECVQEIE